MAETTIKKKIDRALSTGLQNGHTDLEILPNGHVCGHVISPAFKGLTYHERYERIKRILDTALTSDERLRVSTLLTYTPEEWSFAPEDN